MRFTYWKRESLSTGRVISLYRKTEGNGITAHIYKNGQWEEVPTKAAELGWSDEYECITESEAKECMRLLGGNNE